MVWDFTSHKNTLRKGGVRLWCETVHHIRIQSVKGGVRLWCETLHQGWPRVWGGSRSTNPCVFPCKVARPGMKGTSCVRRLRLRSFWFLFCVLQRVVVPVRIVLCVSWICGCRSHWNGCVTVAWAMFWGGSRSTKPFKLSRVKWLRPAVKGTSCVRRGSFWTRLVPPLCSATSGCVCVRSSLRFLNLWLQIALEWLHDCCHLVLPCV